MAGEKRVVQDSKIPGIEAAFCTIEILDAGSKACIPLMFLGGSFSISCSGNAGQI